MPKTICVPLYLLTVLLAASPCTKAETMDNTALVVPNRFAIVQFAFTMAQMRKVELVSYERVHKTGDLLMHVWNPAAREWIKTDIEEYGRGALPGDPVSRVVVIGDENTFPEELVEAAAWCPDIDAINSLDIVTLVNAMNGHFAFTPREWRRLAGLYNLKLRDRNDERRRYGRYGKPGEERTRPVPPRAEQTTSAVLPPGDAAEAAVTPEQPEEEKGVPSEAELKEPAPATVIAPAKNAEDIEAAVKEPEVSKEAEPLPEDK